MSSKNNAATGSGFWQAAEALGIFITFLLMVYANHLVFVVVSNERVMGPVQRIFYFHVGSAIACYCAAGVMLVASLTFLATRKERADIAAEAAAEVAFVFATIVLVTGMIWGHSAWNTWFSWEPRLVSFLIMWLALLGLLLLRVFGDRVKIAQHCAVLGIVVAVTVPIVAFSVKLLPSLGQLHPQVIENRGLRDPMFIKAMFVAMAALVLLQFLLIWVRYRIGSLERSIT